MTTPLQQAARALIDVFRSTGKPIDSYITELRKALDAERAKALSKKQRIREQIRARRAALKATL